ncbi:peptidylprolyl isomerase [bacterium]|nr:peptidylprolyl isomerase [bacterium]
MSRFLFTLAFLIASQLFAQRQLIDKVVAVVDDEVILASELQQYVYFEAQNLKITPQSDPDEFAKIEKRVLEALINQKILLAQAKLDSIVIDDAQVEQTLDQQIQERAQQAGGEQELEKYLGKSIKEIRKLYRANVKKQLLTQRIQSSRFNDFKISRSEVENFFENNKDSLPEVGTSINISQILIEIKPGKEAFEESRKTAVILLDSIRKGADFAQLARIFSGDPGSGKKGGDLGWYNRTDFVKEFAEAAVRLEPGEISDVVRTEFGYHIIQMIEKNVEKIHVRHILISVPTTPQDKTAAKERLEKIRQDIVDDKISFEKAALQYSDDPAKKGNLGNLGWIEIATFQDKSFLKVSQSLAIGEISQPFETNFGFHILKLNDKREQRKLNLKEDWQNIESMALRQKQFKEMEKWIAQIRSKFYVDVRL